MKENEAIKILKGDSCYECAQGTNSPVNCEYGKCRVAEATRVAIKALEEVQRYRAIGTPEECREWKENQTTKKVKNSGERIPFEWYCPTCGSVLCDDGYKDTEIAFCENCGQRLDWSDEE